MKFWLSSRHLCRPVDISFRLFHYGSMCTMDGGTLLNPYAKRGSDATAADDNINERDGNLRSGILSKDISRAPSTVLQDKAAVDVLNYYLVYILGADEIDDIDMRIIETDIESFLTGFSYWLCNTNIPANHQKYLENPDLIPTSFLTAGSLKGYLGKVIQMLRKLFPEDEFWEEEDRVSNISGTKFEKACKRAQKKKDDSFGQESKIGLYRKARHESSLDDPNYLPHWTCLVNCDEICKVMLSKTKIDDIASRMTEKRLALTLTFHAVGRGGETKYLDWKNISFNHWMNCLEALWTELKTLSTYSCPFVPNKDGYLTDVLHALACFFVLGKGLFRGSSSGKKVSTKVMPYLSDEMAHGNVSRWLTTAIRQNFPARVPEEEKKKVTAKSLRIAGTTTMSAGNVDYYSSHARSGHVPTNQRYYIDNSDILSSMPAAMCLAGWRDYHAKVYLPNLACLKMPNEVINNLIDHLVANSLPQFNPNGALRPLLCACIASMIMHDDAVITDLGYMNAASFALRNAFQNSKTVDPRAENDPLATLKLWGNIIRADFQTNNPDFQPLTNTTNSIQVVNSINQIGSSVTELLRENNVLKQQVLQGYVAAMAEREENRKEREAHRKEREESKKLRKEVSRLLLFFNPRLLPQSPSTPGSAPQSPSSHLGKRKAPPVPLVAPAAAAFESGSTNVAFAAATASAVDPASSDSSIQEMAPNYNHVDHNQEHGGTDLPDIISGAYNSRCFRTEVSFTPAFMMRPLRFKDPTKYNHCLALFNVVASPVDRAILGRAGLTKTELSTVAHNIAEASMDHISALEGKPRSNRQRMGYAGVGGRVAKVKNKNPNLRL